MLVVVVAFPRPAGAHAAFVSSDPEPGAELAASPGVVVLRFSEPLIGRLSHATVIDPDGRRFESEPGSERELRIPLATNAPGVYEVRWRTVSPLDGHTLGGGFRFGVGASPGAGAEGGVDATPRGDDLVLAVGRAVEYGALLAAAGMLLVAGLVRRSPELSWVRVRPATALAVALAAAVAVVVGETMLAAETPGAAFDFLGSRQGLVRVGRIAAIGLALGLAMGRHLRWGALLLAASFVLLSASGHAAAVHPAWWGITVDAGHLMAAGLWAGGVLALATVRPPGGWRSGSARPLLHRFTPIALPAFVATVALGTLRGAQELSGVGDLVDNSYGQALSLKVLVALAMVPLSVLAWRYRRPRTRVEAGLVLVAVAVAAVLAAYPLPPGRAAEAEDEQAVERSEALPRPGDLTLGGEAGDTLVGLTLRSGRAGANDVFVYRLPVEGEEAAGTLDTTLLIDGSPVPLERCGSTCRRGRVDSRPGATMVVRVAGPAGGRERFELPEQLPAPDAGSLVRRATDRMNRLRTYRIDEVLGPTDPPLESEYTIQAPDRLRFAMETGLTTVRIGATRYTRPSPDESWQVTRGGPAVDVPVVIWDYPNLVAAHTLGTDDLAGRRTTVVSFFIEVNEAPIWYRLWVADDGLVLRAEMRAQGHFMDHDYSAFDEPLTVEAPAAQTAGDQG